MSLSAPALARPPLPKATVAVTRALLPTSSHTRRGSVQCETPMSLPAVAYSHTSDRAPLDGVSAVMASSALQAWATTGRAVRYCYSASACQYHHHPGGGPRLPRHLGSGLPDSTRPRRPPWNVTRFLKRASPASETMRLFHAQMYGSRHSRHNWMRGMFATTWQADMSFVDEAGWRSWTTATVRF